MTVTPWGDAGRLRKRKLRPGPGSDHGAVVRSQRERLYGATVAVVAEKGYGATRVEDVLVLAGVSRNAFYRHFANKRGCFLATLEAIDDLVEPAIVGAFERAPGAWDRKLAALLDALAALVVAQPALARVAWVEVHAAGPEAVEIVERVDRRVEDIVCRALKDSPERAGMPREIVRAVVGGVRRLVHERVLDGRIAELPEEMPGLFDWIQGYHTPPERLRRPRRVPAELIAPAPTPRDARERILAAVVELVAERGYPQLSITAIAGRASVSLTTFYESFDGKEAAFLAAIASVSGRVLAATTAHCGDDGDWAGAVAVGSRAFLAHLAVNPSVARFCGIGIWASSTGLELRGQGMELFRGLLAEGYRQHPDANPIAAEAIAATVDALLLDALRRKGVERIYELAPTACFIALAPFVGSDRACELANSPPLAVGQTAL